MTRLLGASAAASSSPRGIFAFKRAKCQKICTRIMAQKRASNNNNKRLNQSAAAVALLISIWREKYNVFRPLFMPLKYYALNLEVKMAKYCLGCHKNLAFFLSQDSFCSEDGWPTGWAGWRSFKATKAELPKNSAIPHTNPSNYDGAAAELLLLSLVPQRLLQQLKELELLMCRNCLDSGLAHCRE